MNVLKEIKNNLILFMLAGKLYKDFFCISIYEITNQKRI